MNGKREARLRATIQRAIAKEGAATFPGLAEVVYGQMAGAAAIEELRAAYHEAAHAVACLALHLTFDEVSIVPDRHYDGYLGRKTAVKRMLDRLEEEGATPEIEQEFFNIIVMTFCGVAGMALSPVGLRKGRSYGHQNDFDQAVMLACGLAGDEESWARILRQAETQAVNLITFHPENAARVKKLANALLKQNTLSYQQVQLLFDEATP